MTQAVEIATLAATLGRAASVVGDGSELEPGEAGQLLGCSASTVRRYEVRGWLPEARRMPGSGYRRYARAGVDELAAVLRLPPGPERDAALEELARRNRPAAE